MGNNCSGVVSPRKGNSNGVEPSVVHLSETTGTTEDINVPDVSSTKGKSKSVSFFSKKTRSFIGNSKALSQQSTVISNPSEVENYMIENENLKSEYENIIEKLQAELDKSHEEISRLHSERKLLYVRLDKLNTQMEKLKATEADALERAKHFETERDKIQKVFKSFRESKEKEFQALLREKERLLSLARKFIAEDLIHDALVEGGKYPSANKTYFDSWSVASEGYYGGRKIESESDRGSTQVGVRTSKETLLSLKKLLLQLVQIQDGVPPSNVYSIFLTSSLPMFETTQRFIKSCRKVMLQLEMDGRLCSIKYFPVVAENDIDSVEKKLLMRNCASECDILIALVDIKDERSVTDEIFEMVQGSSKVCIIGSMGCLSSQDKEMIKGDMEMPEKITICESEKGGEDLIENCISKLSELLQYFWKKQVEIDNLVKNPLKTEILSDDLFLHSFDNLGIEEQKRIMELTLAQSHNHSFIPFDKKVSDLFDYVCKDGLFQPYFMNTSWRTGKTFFLSYFISHLQEHHKNMCVLYHFVSPGSENSRDPILMLKRFADILLSQYPSTPEVHHIDKNFPSWLERLCSRYSKSVIIIIDNANLLNNHEEYLKFLEDPLPVTLKVILSVNNDFYPHKWNSWPPLNPVEINPNHCVSHFFNMLKVFMPQEKIDVFINYVKTHQKVIKYLTNHLSRFLICSYLRYLSKPKTQLEEFAYFLEQEDTVKMYVLVTVQLQRTFDAQLVTELLILLYVSRNGLSSMDLFDLTSESTSTNICAILDIFQKFQITWELCGLYQIHRTQMREAIVKMYNLQSETPLSISLRERIIQLSMKKLRARFASYRVADELPWQLMHINNKDALKECIENFAIFIQLHLNSKFHILMDYWKFLNYDANMIFERYMDLLSKMEKEGTFDKTIPMLYDFLGELFQDLGHFSLANEIYEKSSEIKGILYESDDNRVAQSFIKRGELYMQWEKFTTAENFYKHALSIKNENADTSNLEFMRLMDSLKIVSICQKNTTESEKWKLEGTLLRQKIVKEALEKNHESAISECADIIEDMREREVLKDRLPGFMTELGFVYCNLQQFDEASSMLECVVELLVQLYGHENAMVGEAKCHLSSVYRVKSEYTKAEVLLQEALVIYLQSYEENSTQIGIAINSYVELLENQNRFEDTEKLFRQLIKNIDVMGGRESHVLAQTINAFAYFLYKMKRFSEALRMYNGALSIYSQKYGFQHRLVTEVLRSLAKVYHEMRKFDKANAFFDMATDSDRQFSQLTQLTDISQDGRVHLTPTFDPTQSPSTVVSAISDF